MVDCRRATVATILTIAALAGCHRAAVLTTEPAAPAATTDSAPVQTPDRIDRLITQADGSIEAGRLALERGDPDSARREFDTAVGYYLDTAGGPSSNERLANAYRAALETIHVREIEALAGQFRELPLEPASIDLLEGLELTGPAVRSRRAGDEIAIEENEAVRACVELYRGPLRDWFAGALARGGRYLDHIRPVFESRGIPRELAYVALVESAFKPTALSRARARGVWQFMPSTGRHYGLRQDFWVDERSDPEKSTAAAASYLVMLYGLFGDWDLALAAYNAGEGKVARAVKRHGTDDFWALAHRRALPRETRNYVPMIHAAILIARDPAGHGFAVEPEPPLVWDSVEGAGGLDLRRLAQCAGTSLDQMRLLNPALRRRTTPSRKGFAVRVPAGTGTQTVACLEALSPRRRNASHTRVVKRHQALSGVLGTRAGEVAVASGLD